MEISQEQKNSLREIGRKYSLKLLLLHGSYATGKQRVDSDLDIAFLSQKNLGYEQQLDLHSDLAKVFGDSPERDLDVKSLGHTGYLFQFEVARDSQLLYGDELVYHNFRAKAQAQYFDNQPLFDLRGLLTRRLVHKLASDGE